MTKILRIDSSARNDASATRELSTRLIDRLGSHTSDADVTVRDLADGVPLLDEPMLAAMWTPPEQRTDEQNQALRIADAFIAEVFAADVLVIGLPIYNFGPPAALKAWADLVARAGTTFQYGPAGPEGLVPGKPAYVIVASGGVPVGSPMDLSSTWLTTFLDFIGIADVRIIAADQLNVDPDNALDAARARVDDIELAGV